jgi:hypothetical protein
MHSSLVWYILELKIIKIFSRSWLKMKAACSSETFLSNCNNTEHYYRHENLRSRVEFEGFNITRKICSYVYSWLYVMIQKLHVKRHTVGHVFLSGLNNQCLMAGVVIVLLAATSRQAWGPPSLWLFPWGWSWPHLYPMPMLEWMEIYVHSPIRLHVVVFKHPGTLTFTLISSAQFSNRVNGVLVFWLWGWDWRLTGLRPLLRASCPSPDEDEWRGEWMKILYFEFSGKWSPLWNDIDRGKPKNS